MIGKTLGHYQITAHLGTGGMGEVYRALDTKLKREVAIKLLPTEFSEDPERTARFEREATTLASLQHSNIASIYGFEQDQNRRFLVMELVEGEELAGRLERGPIPVDETIDIALQLAEGLEAAHAQGVVHRDLKPANIKITPTRDAKILDFGLARAYTGDAGGGTGTELANSPTITAAMTQAGVILGTAAYMSPEQARGRSVDKQTDIWAFGVVLYEMLSGQRLFGGETVSDSIGAILHHEPDFDSLPAVPPPLRRLLRRCLERERRRRLCDIGDARLELEEAKAGGDPREAAAQLRAGRTPWFVAAFMSLVTIALAWIAFQPDSQVRLPVTTLGLPKNAPIDFDTGGGWPPCDLSPDGKRIVRIGGEESELYLREIDSFEERKLDDTQAAVLPVFSPDGRWIAYFARDKLWKIAVSGGARIELFDTFSGPGLCWGQDEIFFTRSDGGGIWRVGASGGEARQVSALDDARDETSHRWPQLLPGGRHLLVTIKTARIATLDDAQIGIVSLETGETESVFTGGSCARYISTGHLVYGRDNELFAFAFDPVTMKVLGTPTRVLERVETVKVNGAAFFAVSPNGTLSYLPKKTTYAGAEPIWISRTGRIVPVDIIDTPGGELFESVASPDGSRLAAMVPAANDKIWIYDLRRRSFSRLTTTPGNDSGPIWSSDSKLIAYSNDRAGNQDAYLIPADGSSPARPILASEFAEVPTSFSPDGRWLAYSLESPTGKADIWVLSLEEGGESRPFVESRELDEQAQFSPNGRWIAYMSTISGSEDIYARPFPGPGGAVRISTSGGNDPMWSLDGSELFYTDKDVLMVVPISWEPAFDPGEPRPLLRFEANVLSRARITADPERFLGNRYSPEDWRRYEIRLVFDWTDRLNAIR